MKVLITGANGFLGSHFVEKALEKGFETYAAIRANCDMSNLSHLNGYNTVEFDFDSEEKLVAALRKAGPLDLVIHNAGLTKSFILDKYLKVNVGLTERLMNALKSSNSLREGGRFIYVSSLAARGPVGHGGPASKYGISKLRAEENVKASGLDYMIFRPTGIYGSRDVQFVPLFKTVRYGLYPFLTSKAHKMTLINARDVAENVIMRSLEHTNQVVHLDDGHVYRHSDLKKALETILHKKSINLNIPKRIVTGYLSLSDRFARSFNRKPILSLEHYLEISQDWDHDYSEERKKIPLKIDYPLLEGFQEALIYYREKGAI